MSDIVYTITGKDHISNVLKEANEHAETFHHTMERVKEAAEMMGVAFAGYEIISKIKEWGEEYTHLQIANSQLKAGIESTHGAAMMSYDELKKQSSELREHSLQNKESITNMQATLLTFPAVTNAVFKDASQSILDMSQRLKSDPKEAAIQLGKALQDPVKGIAALHRVGVNFSQQQKDMVQQFVASGQTLKAQQLILNELHTEFAGSAKAAFDADPMAQYGVKMEELHEQVGEMVEDFEKWIAPALTSVANAFGQSLTWIKENQDALITTGKILAIAGVGYVAYTGYVYAAAAAQSFLTAKNAAAVVVSELMLAWDMARAEGLGVLTAAQLALNAAMEANPIGLIVAGIAVLGAAFYALYEHSNRFKAAIAGMWAFTKSAFHSLGDIAMGYGKLMLGAITFNPSMMKSGFTEMVGAAKNGFTDAANAGVKAYDETLATANAADWQKKREKEAADKRLKGAAGADGATPALPAASKATGAKSVVVNITIHDMIKEFNVNTTNLKEGAERGGEVVVNALLGAVNQFSLETAH